MRQSICSDGVHIDVSVSDFWLSWRESVALESVFDELAIGTHVGRRNVLGFIAADSEAFQCKCT